MSGQNVLYRFYNSDGELLYIGITNDPWRRFSQHRQDKDWWPDVANICQQSFETPDALRAAEKRAIRRENPSHNKQFNNSESVNATPSNYHCSTGGLVGMFFHSWREVTDPEFDILVNGKAASWQGQVLSQISPEKYLIELFSWLDGSPIEKRISEISQMIDWTFYSNNIEMLVSLGCGEYRWTNDHKDRGRCGRNVIGIAGLEIGFPFSAVCSHCVKQYSSIRPIHHENGEFRLGQAISITQPGTGDQVQTQHSKEVTE